jgi:hypothetical protein
MNSFLRKEKEKSDNCNSIDYIKDLLWDLLNTRKTEIMTKNEIQIDNVVRFFSIPSIHLNVEILFHLQTEYETWNKLDVYCILNKFVTYIQLLREISKDSLESQAVFDEFFSSQGERKER